MDAKSPVKLPKEASRRTWIIFVFGESFRRKISQHRRDTISHKQSPPQNTESTSHIYCKFTLTVRTDRGAHLAKQINVHSATSIETKDPPDAQPVDGKIKTPKQPRSCMPFSQTCRCNKPTRSISSTPTGQSYLPLQKASRDWIAILWRRAHLPFQESVSAPSSS